MDEFERLLDDLMRLADRHPLYKGTVYRTSDNPNQVHLQSYGQAVSLYRFRRNLGRRLRPGDELCEALDLGKKALDSIAPRIARTLVNYGVKLPNGSTQGATVMAWTVLDRFSESRLTAAAPGNAFEFIRERLLELATESSSEAAGASRVRTEQPESTVDPTVTGRGEDRNALIESLEDSARLAILAFDEAAQALSVTADHITDRMAWEWIGENSDAYDRPAFETFSRYLRNARKALGEHKNNPRAGRRGRSVIDESGL